MIEEIVKTYLQNATNTRVGMTTPTNVAGEFIVIKVKQRTLENQIDGVTLEFDSYSDDVFGAATLDEAVRNAMKNIDDLPEILSAEFGGGDDNLDSTLKKPRYRCYFNITY